MRRGAPETGDDQLADEQQLFGQAVVEFHEQLLVREQFALPDVAIHSHQFAELLAGEVLHAAPVEIIVAGHPTNGALDADRAPMRSLDDPFEDAHVFAKTWPEETTPGLRPNQVTAKQRGGIRRVGPEIQPLAKETGLL